MGVVMTMRQRKEMPTGGRDIGYDSGAGDCEEEEELEDDEEQCDDHEDDMRTTMLENEKLTRMMKTVMMKNMISANRKMR